MPMCFETFCQIHYIPYQITDGEKAMQTFPILHTDVIDLKKLQWHFSLQIVGVLNEKISFKSSEYILATSISTASLYPYPPSLTRQSTTCTCNVRCPFQHDQPS